jgi:hypothetical protein
METCWRDTKSTEKKDLALVGIWIDRVAQGWLGLVFCSHIHLIRRAHPSSCKLEILRPPNSIGLQTLPHATWQYPPFASALPLQKKPRRNPQAGISIAMAR